MSTLIRFLGFQSQYYSTDLVKCLTAVILSCLICERSQMIPLLRGYSWTLKETLYVSRLAYHAAHTTYLITIINTVLDYKPRWPFFFSLRILVNTVQKLYLNHYKLRSPNITTALEKMSIHHKYSWGSFMIMIPQSLRMF